MIESLKAQLDNLVEDLVEEEPEVKTAEKTSECEKVTTWGVRGITKFFYFVQWNNGKMRSQAELETSLGWLLLKIGGPEWNVAGGRQDGLMSRILDTNSLPPPTFNLSQLSNVFSRNGLDQQDLVALSGAHTLGFAHCSSFKGRIHHFSATDKIDPAMNKSFAAKLRKICPLHNAGWSAEVSLDPTPNVFDNRFFKELQRGRGVLASDKALLSNNITRGLVSAFAQSRAAFSKAFAKSMVRNQASCYVVASKALSDASTPLPLCNSLKNRLSNTFGVGSRPTPADRSVLCKGQICRNLAANDWFIAGSISSVAENRRIFPLNDEQCANPRNFKPESATKSCWSRPFQEKTLLSWERLNVGGGRWLVSDMRETRKSVVKGSMIGGVKETQEMLDFCGEHNITCDIETFTSDKINEALTRLANNDVKYRFGSDLSILLNSSGQALSEKDGSPNVSLRSFYVINNAKKRLESICPTRVSFRGLEWKVVAGRQDGIESRASDTSRLPAPTFNFAKLMNIFRKMALTEKTWLSYQRQVGRISLDPTPTLFDNPYFKELLKGKGVLKSDEALFGDDVARGWVQAFTQSRDAFFKAFANSMVRMSRIVGNGTEIRKDCGNT
ncbi:hypothetical protein OSB04_025877 [Centaurea solstitialis]|uniref:peroxidase n=1 Tax=Centaurea solstitialis TaxID=347529 RepID=A0AA38WBP2_9ASTR|nr:hypothetical protein OSB04_025877 [Centaurea solstitialis]